MSIFLKFENIIRKCLTGSINCIENNEYNYYSYPQNLGIKSVSFLFGLGTLF